MHRVSFIFLKRKKEISWSCLLVVNVYIEKFQQESVTQSHYPCPGPTESGGKRGQGANAPLIFGFGHDISKTFIKWPSITIGPQIFWSSAGTDGLILSTVASKTGFGFGIHQIETETNLEKRFFLWLVYTKTLLWVGAEQKKVEAFLLTLILKIDKKLYCWVDYIEPLNQIWKKSEYVMMQKIVPDNQTHAITTFCI